MKPEKPSTIYVKNDFNETFKVKLIETLTNDNGTIVYLYKNKGAHSIAYPYQVATEEEYLISSKKREIALKIAKLQEEMSDMRNG